MREFNATGACFKEDHYMVDISGKLDQIAAMVAKGQYFTINSTPKYGKTTTLELLKEALAVEYLVIKLNLLGIGESMFTDEATFCQCLLHEIRVALGTCDAKQMDVWQDEAVRNLSLLSDLISANCINKKVVLIVDGIDKVSDIRIFLNFLEMLRVKHRHRETAATFHSAIITKNQDFRSAMQNVAQSKQQALAPSEDAAHSPWNSSAKFEVDMSFSPDEIASMLQEYEAEHNLGMDIATIARELRRCTQGYPYLVSRVCKVIDEKLGANWTKAGVQEAVQLILHDDNIMLDDTIMNMKDSEGLADLLSDMAILLCLTV